MFVFKFNCTLAGQFCYQNLPFRVSAAKQSLIGRKLELLQRKEMGDTDKVENPQVQPIDTRSPIPRSIGICRKGI